MKLFRNALVYQLEQGGARILLDQLFDGDTDALGAKAGPLDPAPFEMDRDSWVEPFVDAGRLYHEVRTTAGCAAVALRMRTARRILSGGAVQYAFKQRRAHREREEGRTLTGPEQARLRNEIRESMMAAAPIAESFVDGFIDVKRELIIINATSPCVGGAFLELLRESTEGWRARRLGMNDEGPSKLDRWLIDDSARPANVQIEDAAQLVAEGGATVRLANARVETEAVSKHMLDGFHVAQLAMWVNGVSFTLGSNMRITRLTFPDGVLDDIDTETPGDEYAAMALINHGTIAELLDFLLPQFADHPWIPRRLRDDREADLPSPAPHMPSDSEGARP